MRLRPKETRSFGLLIKRNTEVLNLEKEAMLLHALLSPKIRAYEPVQDAPWLHRLWHDVMDARWSLSLESMQDILAYVSLLLVAECDGIRIGFCATNFRRFGDAGLLTLLVEPAFQHHGVGSALLLRLQSMLEAEQVRSLQFGAVGTGAYFWPGMPAENDSAQAFFMKCGWREEAACADLVQELTTFRTPFWVSSRITKAKVVLRVAHSHLHAEIADFERTNFPAWAPFVENELASSGGENVVVAQTADGVVVGTVLVRTGFPSLWSRDAGLRIGTLNILGIAPSSQRQGIGLALVARALETLRERGCSRCYIQWTGLSEWYGKLGAKVWAEYRRASRTLSPILREDR